MVQIAFCVLVITCAAFALGRQGYYQEETCTRYGGKCDLKSACPETKLKGLCPLQEAQGAECCSPGPPGPLDCSSNGGICRDTCPILARLDYYCSSGRYCCRAWR